MKDDRIYLKYILETIRRIEKHRRSGRRRFLGSDTIQDAVLRNMQTMAEATQRLSDEIIVRRDQSHATTYPLGTDCGVSERISV